MVASCFGSKAELARPELALAMISREAFQSKIGAVGKSQIPLCQFYGLLRIPTGPGQGSCGLLEEDLAKAKKKSLLNLRCSQLPLTQA